MLAETNNDTASFEVKYAGLVQDIRGDFDPSGRTDLLKILDKAKLDGQVVPFGNLKDFVPDANLCVTKSSITITSIVQEEVLLRAPVFAIASVGLVKEGYENIIPIKIGGITTNADLFDLAIIYCLKSDNAVNICKCLGQCFSQVYGEIASSADKIPPIAGTSQLVTCTTGFHPSFLTDSHQDLRSVGVGTYRSTTASRSDSLDEKTDELIKDYIAKLATHLTAEELAQYAGLIVRWREGTMPMTELAQKLAELYGPERQDLLIGMRCLIQDTSREDVQSFNEFLEKLNSSNSGRVVLTKKLKKNR